MFALCRAGFADQQVGWPSVQSLRIADGNLTGDDRGTHSGDIAEPYVTKTLSGDQTPVLNQPEISLWLRSELIVVRFLEQLMNVLCRFALL